MGHQRLGKADQPGADAEALLVAGHFVAVDILDFRPDRARPDKHHVAAQDVDQLRQLVEPRTAQIDADAGFRHRAARQSPVAGDGAGLEAEGAELEDVEFLAVLAQAAAGIEHRPAHQRLLQQDDQQQQRADQRQQQQRQAAVDDGIEPWIGGRIAGAQFGAAEQPAGRRNGAPGLNGSAVRPVASLRPAPRFIPPHVPGNGWPGWRRSFATYCFRAISPPGWAANKNPVHCIPLYNSQHLRIFFASSSTARSQTPGEKLLVPHC